MQLRLSQTTYTRSLLRKPFSSNAYLLSTHKKSTGHVIENSSSSDSSTSTTNTKVHGPSQSSASTSTSSSIYSNASDKLFADAAREEAAEAQPLLDASANSRTGSGKSQYLQSLENQHMQYNWDGDERMEDAVLRMLVDKYKPLRTAGGIRTAEEKLKANPPRVRGVVVGGTGIGAEAEEVEQEEENLDMEQILEAFTRNAASTSTGTTPSGYGPAFSKTTPSTGSWATETLLPSSETHRPWHTEYRVPSHVVSSIKLANIPPPKPSSLGASSSSSSGTSLAKDERARKKEKEYQKRTETAGRLGRARESTLDYRLGLKQKMMGGIEQGATGGRPNPISLKGWTGLIEDKIERARSRGVFNNLNGRGKPLVTTTEERNPFIAREEFLMNRIVQRHGAAPPWVELQSELDTAIKTFRDLLRQSWTRRAIRNLTTLHPPNLLLRFSLTDIKNLRDAEWEKRERSYHDTAVEEVNALVRKYNGIAPYAVRRAYYMRSVEIEKVYGECAEDILKGIKGRLTEAGGNPGVVSSGSRPGSGVNGHPNDARAEDPGFVGLGDWFWGWIGKPGDIVAVNHAMSGRREGLVVGSHIDYLGRQIIEVQLENELYHAWYPTVTRVKRIAYRHPTIQPVRTTRTIERRIFF
ncbi:hypothetical protein D9758_004245 [Tetrapyrgos nigripes]|uniref:DnaJ homologue subfamily C member 28 conserved domain-containing protein n=1 Tax=Tetrapyrgos nigripes TaxID=182062 RepID=A0A8H5LVQ0_9AGAR|nr:hypothetical protein D9758_004245 [Tetrapyrgos nigripes]